MSTARLVVAIISAIIVLAGWHLFHLSQDQVLAIGVLALALPL